MTMRRMLLLLWVCAAVSASAQTPQPAPEVPPEFGPAHGTLMIIGGGLKSESLLKQFIDLSGGPEASILLVPTAAGGDGPAYYWEDLQDLERAGARHITVLHTRDRKVADSEAFVAPIRQAGGVFLMGGRQWRLADAYLHTRTHRELQALLDRGGIIAGTSAGASIQASFLVRGESTETAVGNTLVGDHTEGFGFLKGVAIDQHVLKRNRQFYLIPVIEAHPELLGIGIDEDTAIVVRRDRFEVAGSSYVLVYDNQRMVGPAGQFYFLAPGDRYNLKTREAERPQMRGVPVERVTKQPWKK
jgi:cyanophycinase